MKLTQQLVIVGLVVAGICRLRVASSVENNNWPNDDNDNKPAIATDATQRRADVADEWITQKLDHFDDSETRTWKMRYLSNDKYFIDGGPMFILIGGEVEISPSNILNGHLRDMAKEHKGYLYYTEHRYYGKSRPTADLATPNLKHLNAKQALADLAHFIRTKKAEIPGLANSKVIVAGGSYAGSLVVWLKRLYPELVDGGWSSSAPLLAKADFTEYKEIVGEGFRVLGSQQCYERIRNGIAELAKKLATSSLAEIKSLLKICNSFDETNELDVWSLFGSISSKFSAIVQNQRRGEVRRECSFIMKSDDDLTAIVDFILRSLEKRPCWIVSYKGNVDHLSKTANNISTGRQWFYQRCNEFGWFLSSGSPNQPFGSNFPVSLYTDRCADVFGKEYTNSLIEQKIGESNKFFGGMNPNVANVYMTQGEFDPWRPMGHQAKDGATIIPLASHVQDFDSIMFNDSPEMRASKERVSELVRGWIG